MTDTYIFITVFDCLPVILWAVSIFALYTLAFKSKRTKMNNIESWARFFIYYTLISTLFILLWKGNRYITNDSLLANITTEIIGITISAFLVDRIYNYIASKNEELYKNIALRTCRLPIYYYCALWFDIYEPVYKNREKITITYPDLESFFKSDEFYEKITEFDFNDTYLAGKKYAQHYFEEIEYVKNSFQNILIKYASKLSLDNIELLEHFGGRAYLFTAFISMKFSSETNIYQYIGENTKIPLDSFNNNFKDIEKHNLDKHFDEFIELIAQHNEAVKNKNEKVTINDFCKIREFKRENNDPTIKW